MFNSLLSLLFPPICPICSMPLLPEDTRGVCASCMTELAALYSPKLISSRIISDAGICRATVLFPYRDAKIKKMIFAAKTRGSRTAVRFFASYAADGILSEKVFSSAQIITYAPRRKSALYKSGNDQAFLYAKDISTLTGIPCSRLISRTGGFFDGRREQKTLGQAERAKNVRGSFRASPDASGKRILLIDDVMTTGSTLSEAARVLLASGAASVCVIAISG
ncbi:Orotate phosphoribosyltransferase [bioreactor metagenome]|uniref:Orotate phosphoribosyltransferase n=1 Tax=bioreactor metagenome TaxID=1076179 RepID=A0A644YYP5_9ZZZZ